MPLFYPLVRHFLIISLVWVGKLNALSAPNADCSDYWELSYAHPHLDRADSLRESEEYDRALILYQQAAEKFRPEKNWAGLLKARNLVSDILRTKFQYDTALTILVDNIKIVEDYLNNDPAELATIFYIQAVNYDWQRKYDLALKSFNQALDLRKDLYGEVNLDVALTYSAMGEMYLYRQQYLNAKKFLTKAIDIIEQLDCRNSSKVGNTYYYLASSYRHLRDFEKAGIYGLKALSLQQNNTLNDQTRCYNLLGNVNQGMQNYQQSNQYNFKAIDLLLQQKPLSNTQRRDLANYYNSVASNYTESQHFDSADLYYKKSLTVYRSLRDANDAISLSYMNIGVNFTGQKNYDSANYFLFQSLALRKQIFGDKNSNTASTLTSIGDLFESQGDLESALDYYQQAIIAASTGDFSSLEPSENPTSASFTYDGALIDALWSKAIVLEDQYQAGQAKTRLEQALETLVVAIDLIDKNQQLYQLELSTLLMTRDYYGIFEKALGLCFELYNLTEDEAYLERVFYIMEKSKARLLFDTFADLQTNKLLGIPDSLIEVENSIKSRLAAHSRNLEDHKKTLSADPQKTSELQEKVFGSTVELENFYQSLDSIYPSYSTAVTNEMLDLNTIQQKVIRDQIVLVNYFWGDSTLFMLCIGENGIDLFRQPTAPLAALIFNYQKQLMDGPQFEDQSLRFKEFSSNAHLLYNYLLRGIESNHTPLIIAADGPLRFIPFEGLVVEKPESEQTNYHQLKYLVNHRPTSYVYSANLWAMENSKISKKPQVLGFSHSGPNAKGGGYSNELPGTATEIGILKDYLKGLFFSGLEATKQKFLEHARDFEIIHLAIHGISDSVSRLNNRLLFRDPENPDLHDPLYTYELYTLNLSSRLAVLSSCDSGIGRNYQGEGVYSMSRAFSYAGCPTTVMSLWKIPDNTTPGIIEPFYKEVSKGRNIDLALQRAKLQYISENPGNRAHPGLWAAMVVHGSSDSIAPEPSWALYIFASIASLAIVILVYKKSSSKFLM